MSEEDADMMRRAQEGDPVALGLLVEKHAEYLWARAKALVFKEVSREDRTEAARDLYQQSWEKIFTSLHTFRGDSSSRTWVNKILENAWYQQQIRKPWAKKAVSFEVSQLSYSENGAPKNGAFAVKDRMTPEREQFWRDLHAALETFAPRYREPFERHYLRGQELAEIARALKITLNCAKSRVRRAREKLTTLLAAYRDGFGDEPEPAHDFLKFSDT